MRYPEAIRTIINFTIPAGYKAVGIQNLNMNLDNEVGTFAVQASVEGTTLNILVKKHYKQTNVKKEDWPKLVAMLDAAFNFSQKMVLLKKM
jgi:glutamate racemase